MEDTKIVLKNSQNAEKFKDYFNPDAKEFDITNEVMYTFNDYPVSPAEAHKRGFTVDPKFKLPFGVSDRIKVAEYVQNTLGITRVSNPALYFRVWKQLSEGLPAGNIEELRPHSTIK
jgi:hypothetical protein